MNNKYGVRVPATTANIGSGFDTLGIALGLYNEIYFEPERDKVLWDTEFIVEGEGINEIVFGKGNMILSAMQAVGNSVGKSICGGKMNLINHIPLARGLGSSSSALVAGAYLANLLLNEPLGKEELLNIVAKIEGHPDNVSPAVFGGFCVSLMNESLVSVAKIEISSEWKAVVAIPEYELLTADSRAVLPATYSRADAVHNIGAVSFLMSAFMLQNPEYLRHGLSDRIHVPYRLELIPGAEGAIQRAYENGGYGATISGSGPTIIAFTSPSCAECVGEAMVEGFNNKNIEAKYMVLDFDQYGVKTIELDNY